jgi:hypothetical protein
MVEGRGFVLKLMMHVVSFANSFQWIKRYVTCLLKFTRSSCSNGCRPRLCATADDACHAPGEWAVQQTAVIRMRQAPAAVVVSRVFV